jgi:hypothetical protein
MTRSSGCTGALQQLERLARIRESVALAHGCLEHRVQVVTGEAEPPIATASEPSVEAITVGGNGQISRSVCFRPAQFGHLADDAGGVVHAAVHLAAHDRSSTGADAAEHVDDIAEVLRGADRELSMCGIPIRFANAAQDTAKRGPSDSDETSTLGLALAEGAPARLGKAYKGKPYLTTPENQRNGAQAVPLTGAP